LSKTLITGGGGFLGLHLARRLLGDGHAVDLIDDFSRGRPDADLEQALEWPGVRLIEADLLSPDAAKALDSDYRVIVHLAAIVGVANVVEQPLRVLTQNVELLLRMLEAAGRQKRLERFLFASTSEAYAGTLESFGVPIPTPEAVPLTISDPSAPRSSYLLSKIYGEALCVHSGLPFTVVRPHNVYGPRMGMAHVIPELLQRADAAPDGGSLSIYSPDHRRTFCFVDDAVEILARAAFLDRCQGQVMNVGAQQPEVSIRELAGLVTSAVGKRLEIISLGATPGSPARRCPDMSLTTALTGHTAEVSLKEGIQRTYQWYRPTFTSGGGSEVGASAER
jgi:UDP-glucose 4-epimerase